MVGTAVAARGGVTVPGKLLGLAEGDAAGLAGVTGVTGWTCTGGAGETTNAGAAEGVLTPTAGTGVNGNGVEVGVGVSPLMVELTICRVGTAVGTGVS